MKRLGGKAALITGAARGIGRAFAEAYVREGARVAIADINAVAANKTADDLGEAAVGLEMDVTRQSSIDAAVAGTVAQFGRIDILINNAALFTAAPIIEIERAGADAVHPFPWLGSMSSSSRPPLSGTLWMPWTSGRVAMGAGG